MKALRALVLTLTLAVFAVTAEAQVEVTLTGAGSTVYGGVYVGPYTASIPGFASIDFYCNDFINSVRIGDTWNANMTSLGSFIAEQTRFGQYYGNPALDRYKQAVWLTMQFGAFTGLPTATRGAAYGTIHEALWRTFTDDLALPNTSEPNWNASYDGTSYAQWMTDAENADLSGINWDYWYVVTDVNTVDGVGGKQEYLTYVTPEPATIFLMGTGLVAVLGMTLVTRRSLG
jgi:hypothetical protein